MTMVRVNPVPAGTYWMDPAGDKVALWHAYVSGLNKDVRRVVVNKIETHPAEGNAPAWEWIRFTVVDEGGIIWDHEHLGNPNTATPNIQTSDDTVTKPDVPGPLDGLSSAAANAAAGLGTPAKVLVWSLVGLVGVAGVALIWRIARPRTRTRESVTGHVWERTR